MLMVCWGANLSAQDIQLYHQGRLLQPKETITIAGDPSQSQLTFKVDFKNNSDRTINIKLQKVENDIAEGSQNAFCFVNCYEPGINTSLSWVITEPGDWGTEANFSAYYYPNSTEDQSVILYKFFDKDDSQVSSSVRVIFTTEATGVKQEGIVNAIDMRLKGKQLELNSTDIGTKRVMVYDVSGRLLDHKDFCQSTSFDLNHYRKGVYIIQINGKEKSLLRKKIVL